MLAYPFTLKVARKHDIKSTMIQLLQLFIIIVFLFLIAIVVVVFAVVSLLLQLLVWSPTSEAGMQMSLQFGPIKNYCPPSICGEGHGTCQSGENF